MYLARYIDFRREKGIVAQGAGGVAADESTRTVSGEATLARRPG